eukprot:3238842-Rhodomonas_salina.1
MRRKRGAERGREEEDRNRTRGAGREEQEESRKRAGRGGRREVEEGRGGERERRAEERGACGSPSAP